jgi:hypothetical protein
MEDYSEHRCSKEQLHAIFENDTDRSIFINNYAYFFDDENSEFYLAFINENITSLKYKNQEDALELSIAIHYFELTHLDVVRNIIYSNRLWWIKLLCLDWLVNFADEIPLQTFFELNERITGSTNELLKIQSMLNILLFKTDNQLIKSILKLVKKSKEHIVFYRFASYKRLDKVFTIEQIRQVLGIIETTVALSDRQKVEISKSIWSHYV